jgi:hypothetical protein
VSSAYRTRVRGSLVVAVLVAGAGCSSTLLVGSGDATFRDAQQRLARTAELVESSGAPPGERWLFMQAESLYRYRFELPGHSGWSYLAEATAALTDFPAFQALAGALDLGHLRLRSYDGAVQLWESLLREHPRTALRPLALYRLGWAYRSSGASGFPRASGDEAFAELLAQTPALPLADLARSAQQTPWKSKSRATELSLIPGLGQIYVGQVASGVSRLGIALAALAMVLTPAVVAYQRRDDLGWRRDWPLLAIGIGGLVILSIDYTRAYEDAERGVVLFNERAEGAFARRHPTAP